MRLTRALPAALCLATAAALRAPNRPEHGQEVLLVLVGVLRDFENSWEAIREQIVLPNEQAGYRFTIVLHTQLGCSCGTKSDPVAQAAPGKPRAAAIRKVFGGRNVSIMDSEDTCVADGKGYYVHSFFGDQRSYHCGAQHFASRVVQGLDAHASEQKWSKVLVMRADVQLMSLQRKGITSLELDSTCQGNPGINIITGYCQNSCTGWHWNDVDMAWLLCDGSKHRLLRDVIGAIGQPCTGDSCAAGKVTLPSDFHPLASGINKTGGRSHIEVPWNCNYKPMICRSVQLAQEAKVRFGTLEKYMHVRKSFRESCCGGRDPSSRGTEASETGQSIAQAEQHKGL